MSGVGGAGLPGTGGGPPAGFGNSGTVGVSGKSGKSSFGTSEGLGNPGSGKVIFPATGAGFGGAAGIGVGTSGVAGAGRATGTVGTCGAAGPGADTFGISGTPPAGPIGIASTGVGAAAGNSPSFATNAATFAACAGSAAKFINPSGSVTLSNNSDSPPSICTNLCVAVSTHRPLGVNNNGGCPSFTGTVCPAASESNSIRDPSGPTIT